MESQKIELTADLEAMKAAKQQTHDQMKKEHENHRHIQGKLNQLEANEEKFKTQQKYIKELMENTSKLQESAESELTQARSEISEVKANLQDKKA